MASYPSSLDWESPENHFMINPRWPAVEAQRLADLAKWAEQQQSLQAHVWIATSGSTANSVTATKLVALSKQALLNSANAANQFLECSNKDIWAQVLPAFHVGGLGIGIRASLVGAQVVSALEQGRWNPEFFHRVLVDSSCTLASLVPTQVYDLVHSGLRAPKALRAIVVGGGALSVELYHEAKKWGWPVLPSYGMTETASQIATASLQSIHSEEFPEMELLPHAKAEVDEDGFLKVQTSSLLSCYAQITESGFTCWDPKVAGWFRTEDRGRVEGRSIFVEGRSQDYIKIGGEGTNLSRLRTVLDTVVQSLYSERQLQVTLLVAPSERLGMEIHLVSCLDEASSEILAQRFAQVVLPFEKIRKIHYVSEIPRSDLGKILWQPLRKICKIVE